MSTVLILIIVLLLVGVGGAPNWGLHQYGWGPSGGIGLVLLILVILALVGRI